MVLGLCESLWLKLLLQDLGYVHTCPIQLYCDNKVMHDIAHNSIQHDSMKHVEVNRFFIKEKLDENILELPNIRFEDKLTNILTKVMTNQIFGRLLDKLGMYDIHHLPT
uniref:Copia protein n=1 Tax=Cajanus cajan TaxID=3821 RepID=A0A151RZ74_CAJCA|nr:Copia protein [Cajanus cajan]